MPVPQNPGRQPLPDDEDRELASAVADLGHELTHDLSDTPRDVGDAVAFAPIGVAKVLMRGWRALARR